MADEDETTETETVYTLGRSGRDASTYCKNLDALIGFLPHLAAGDYWISRCLVARVPGGYRDPIEQADWGVVRVDELGGFILQGLAGRTTERERDLAFRDAWKNSILPGPGRDS